MKARHNEKNYTSHCNQVRIAIPEFPRENLGKEIEKLKNKWERAYRLDAKGEVALKKIDTLEQYIVKLLSCYPGDFSITERMIKSMILVAQYWSSQQGGKFTQSELIIIQIAQLALSHTSVLYAKDVAPAAQNLEYQTTIISTDITRPISRVEDSDSVIFRRF